MPAAKIDTLLDLWMSSLYPHGAQPPFRDHCHLYKVIDTTMAGDVRWQCFIVDYTGEVPNTDPPKWMVQKHEVWFCDSHQVNPGFMDEMDLQPFQEFSMHDHTRHYKDLMSGDWAWEQADMILEDKSTIGSTFVPIILGNNSMNEYFSDPSFHNFHRQLFHSLLSTILQLLKPAMTTPEVVKYADGHFQHTIYGLGSYIADYKEQVLLTCIVHGWCPRCQSCKDNLDGDSLDHSLAFNEVLFEESNFNTMWDKFGIVTGLVVCDRIMGCISCNIKPHHCYDIF
ncbi:hypothetical protein V8E55_010013 [Tylopilus felleus]